jgi:hypothetical protein
MNSSSCAAAIPMQANSKIARKPHLLERGPQIDTDEKKKIDTV